MFRKGKIFLLLYQTAKGPVENSVLAHLKWRKIQFSPIDSAWLPHLPYTQLRSWALLMIKVQVHKRHGEHEDKEKVSVYNRVQSSICLKLITVFPDGQACRRASLLSAWGLTARLHTLQKNTHSNEQVRKCGNGY